VILSDTFEQFARPLMAKLGYPTLFCNSLITAADGAVTGYRLRQRDGKKRAVAAFKTMGLRVFASGDSFNDLAMLGEADEGCLFRASERIRRDRPHIPYLEGYGELLGRIEEFVGRDSGRGPEAP
jgi:phosphoserine/homoserine phosphotransferase